MADRLQELLQQRALIKEHLAWIEGEIAAASGRPTPRPEPLPAVAAPTPVERLPAIRSRTPITHAVAAPPVRDDADVLIAKLAAAENHAAVPTKKGCWIFFYATLVVVAIVAWILLRYFYRG